MKVENIYQGSKVMRNIYTGEIVWLQHLYSMSSMEAKKCPTLTDKYYELTGFNLMDSGLEYPRSPRYIFYNYIYIKSLVAFMTQENMDFLITYDGFTDTMLSWYKGKVTSCQAHAVAMCVGMIQAGTYDYHMNGSLEQYLEIYK